MLCKFIYNCKAPTKRRGKTLRWRHLPAAPRTNGGMYRILGFGT